MKKECLFSLIWVLMAGLQLSAQKTDRSPAVSVELSKMNVLYVGVDNPIQVSCEGLSSGEYQVKSDQGTLTNTGIGNYRLNVNAPGKVTLNVSTSAKEYYFPFRVKRIPDPIPSLGAKYNRSDTLSLEAFKAQKGIALLLLNFDFEAKCDIVEYKVVHIGQNPETGVMLTHSVKNVGARFSPESLELIEQAKPGDIYIITDLKGRCPGDVKERELNGLVFFLDDRK